jgi:ketosteroid isomerase-like protein
MADTTEQILRHEAQLLDAKRALDIAVLDRLYADDLLMSGVMGEPTCSKTAIIDEVRGGIAQRQGAAAAAAGGPHVEASVDNEDMKVAAHGDTGIANYRFVVKVKGSNIDVERRYRATNVWMNRGGQWQIVAAHVAFVLDPTQAAMLSGERR